MREVTLGELEANLELRKIYYFELSGRRRGSAPGSNEIGPEDKTQSLQVMRKLEEDRMSIRTRMNIQTSQADIIVDLAAIFSPKEGSTFPSITEKNSKEECKDSYFVEEETIRQFIEKVGIPTLFPFIRESVHSTARRLGVKAPLIGLLRPGGVELTRDPADELNK